MSQIEWPTQTEVADSLKAEIGELISLGSVDPEGIDVRLSVSEDGWSLHFGDSGYDTDHRGFWGSGSADTESDLDALAFDLLEQALDSYAQIEED